MLQVRLLSKSNKEAQNNHKQDSSSQPISTIWRNKVLGLSPKVVVKPESKIVKQTENIKTNEKVHSSATQKSTLLSLITEQKNKNETKTAMNTVPTMTTSSNDNSKKSTSQPDRKNEILSSSFSSSISVNMKAQTQTSPSIKTTEETMEPSLTNSATKKKNKRTSSTATAEVSLLDLILAVNGKKSSGGSKALKGRNNSIVMKEDQERKESSMSSNPIHSKLKEYVKSIEEKSVKKYIPVIKKKKKFSKMKKRILLARLHQHMSSLNIIPSLASSSSSSSSSSIESTFTTIRLKKFADWSDIEDEEERDEILENAKTLTSPFGLIKSMEWEILEDENICNILITYSDSLHAFTASQSLRGMIVGNRPIETELMETLVSKPLLMEECDHFTINKQENYEIPVYISPIIPYSTVVKIRNMIFPEDISDVEEAEEVMRNLQAICEDYGTIVSVWLENKPRIQNEFKLSSPSSSSSSSIDPQVHLYFDNLYNSLLATSKLVGKMIGGQILSCMLHVLILSNHINSSDDNFISNHDMKWMSLPVNMSYKLYISHFSPSNDMNIEKQLLDNGFHFVITSMNNSNSQNRSGYKEPFDNISNRITEQFTITIHIRSLYDYLKVMEILDLNDNPKIEGMFRQIILIGDHLSCPICINHLNLDSYLYLSESIPIEDIMDNKMNATNKDKYPITCIKSIMVSVDGYISMEDIQESSFDELVQLKKDIVDLIVTDDHNLFPSSIRYSSTLFNRNHDDKDDEDDDDEVIGCVGFENTRNAFDAMINIDGSTIGGNLVVAEIDHYVINGNNSKHEKSYERDTEGIKDNRKINDSNIKESKESVTTSLPMNGTVNGTTSTTNNLSSNMKSNDKELKYAEAVNKPHLPKHTAPIHTHVPVANEEIDKFVQTMLDSLATFQKRLKERDPIKAKSKLRFVVGMKQVINASKTSKVKLILLAPDTEINEELDDKLEQLISMANSSDIPIMYTLSRRRLAKACQLSMRQSVVAIYDPDGVYDQFKKIIAYITQFKEDRKEVVEDGGIS